MIWSMENWLDTGALNDIPTQSARVVRTAQGARVVKTAQGCVAVFRTADDQIFAMNDRCPHKGGPCQRVSCMGPR